MRKRLKWGLRAAALITVFACSAFEAQADPRDDLALAWSNMRAGRCQDAWKLFQSAANAGSPSGAFRFVLLALSTNTNPEDTKKLLDTLIWSAKNGNLDAEVCLGGDYVEGHHFKANYVEGMAWLKVAGYHGDPTAAAYSELRLQQFGKTRPTEAAKIQKQITARAQTLEKDLRARNVAFLSDGNNAIWPRACSQDAPSPARLLSGDEVKARIVGRKFKFTVSESKTADLQSEMLAFHEDGKADVKRDGLWSWAEDKNAGHSWRIDGNKVCYTDKPDDQCWRIVQIGEQYDWVNGKTNHLRRPDSDAGEAVP